jgi:microcystin-dependent protein
MADPYIGEIRAFGFNFVPVGWLSCNGGLLPISQFQALFAILGTTYGGNGQTNFALPNLNNSTVMGTGDGPGLSPRALGESVGIGTVTVLQSEMPQHTHALDGFVSRTPAGETAGPSNTAMLSRGVTMVGGQPQTAMVYSTTDVPNTMMAAQTIGVTGGTTAHPNQQPYLALNFCIAYEGVFPPHP